VRLARFLLLALACGFGLAAGAPAQQPVRVAVLERPAGGDRARPVLAESVRALGATPLELLPAAKKGDLPLGKTDLLLVGGFFTSPEDEATATLVRRREALRGFVAGGGTLLVFAQSYQRNELSEKLLPETKKPDERRPWAFAEPEYPLEFTPQQWDDLYVLEPEHPLLSAPRRIDAARLRAAKGERALGGDCPLGVVGVRMIVGRRYRLAYPWLSEAAIGRGRLLVCGGAPDLARRDASPEALETVKDFVENAIAYAGAVRAKTVAPFAPTFKELPVSTKDAVAEFDDWAGFEKRVSAAVDRGVVALRKMQKDDGSFGTFGTSFGAKNYTVGQTALAMTALLASGVSKHDDAVRRALAALPKAAPQDSYQAGVLAFALDHFAAPDGERFDLARLSAAERAKYVFKRFLTPEQKKTMEEAAAWLVNERYRGFWRYLADPRDADLSASQYAALGLIAAQRCGVAVPREVFDKMIDGLLAVQTKGKERTYAFPRREPKPREWPEFEETKKAVGFWNYEAPVRAEWGRGTTDMIGVAMLVIALDGLSRDGLHDARSARVAAAIDYALNHLDAIFRVDVQPADAGRPFDKFPDFYYLYTLERAMVLGGRRFVGRHDWYREAAEFLLDVQRADGRFDVAGAQYRSDAIHTAFALLTLKRATIPARVTPR
jgi:hypothetical protein